MPAHRRLPTFRKMTILKVFRAINANQGFRVTQLVVGVVLLVATPVVSLLPGPGGVFVFAAGLGLTLRNSMWAKRKYARFKKHQPKAGGWADWGLRRSSAKRRAERAKAVDKPDG